MATPAPAGPAATEERPLTAPGHASEPAPAVPASAPASLRSLAMRGAAWTLGQILLGRGLRLASNLLLTRLLFPEAFGLMALVNVFRHGLAQLSSVGIVPSVVRSPRGDDPTFLSTAWTAQIARGLVLFALAGLAAPGLAHFYDLPELAVLVPVASLTLVIDGVRSMSISLYRRNLSVGRLAGFELGAQTLSLVVMALWAWIHPTVWALVAGGLVGSGFKLLLSFTVDQGRFRARLRWEPEAVQELLHFGKWVFLSTLLSFTAGHVDRFIFGKTIPIAMLGVYSVAVMLSTLPSDLLARLGNMVIFPALSRKLDESGDLSNAYRRARAPLLGVAGLLSAWLISVGDPLVQLLYDPRFHAAGWMLPILAVGTWFRALEVPAGSALLALGHPRPIAAGHGAKVIAIAVLIPLGFWQQGLPGALAALTASQVALYAVVMASAARRGLHAITEDLVWTALVALAAGGGFWVSGRLEGAGAAIRLAAGLAVTSGLWIAAALALLRSQGMGPRELARLIRSPRSGARPNAQR